MEQPKQKRVILISKKNKSYYRYKKQKSKSKPKPIKVKNTPNNYLPSKFYGHSLSNLSLSRTL